MNLFRRTCFQANLFRLAESGRESGIGHDRELEA